MTATDQAHRPVRDEILTELAKANHEAKRQPRVFGSPEWPSKWDQWHEWIDLLLEDWMAVK